MRDNDLPRNNCCDGASILSLLRAAMALTEFLFVRNSRILLFLNQGVPEFAKLQKERQASETTNPGDQQRQKTVVHNIELDL